MEASSLLREMAPGQEACLEVAPAQRSKMNIILRHRNAMVVSQEQLPEGNILLVVKKRSG